MRVGFPHLTIRSTVTTMGQFNELPYDTMIHDIKTGRLATLAEIVARHSREQQISLEDADAYVKELLEIPSSRFHIEDESIDTDEDQELAYEIQRVQHAQVAAQTLLATSTLLAQQHDIGIEGDRVKRLLHGAFDALETFYSETEKPEA